VRTRYCVLLLLFVFSLSCFWSCQDRLFDNPFDPQAGQIILEIVNTILTSAFVPQGLCWDGSTIWNVDVFSNTLYSLNRLSGAQVRALTSPVAATSGVAYDGQDLWVCSETSVEIYKINLLNGNIQKRLHLQRGAFTAIEYGLDSLWLADAQSNKIP